MKKVFALMFLFSSNQIIAQERPNLALDRFSLQLMGFSCNRDPQTPDTECKDYKGRVATNFDLQLFKNGFWRNEIHGEGTKAAFTTVGWHWELGFKVSPQIEMFYEHHSRHVLDRKQPKYWSEKEETLKDSKFPVEDSFGVRLIFFQRKQR